MKNEYLVIGEITAILLYGGRRTLISTNKLEKAKSIPGTWTADKEYNSDNYYVKTQIMEKDKSRTIVLARFLTDAPPGTRVDHLNHHTLDNTDGNLRVVTPAVNSQNMIKPKNNTSGYRGVSNLHK